MDENKFIKFLQELSIPSPSNSEERKRYEKFVKAWKNEGEPYDTTYGFVDYAIDLFERKEAA